MSTFWAQKDRQPPVDATYAGGEASLWSIFTAAHDQMRFVDNLLASDAAMDAAIDRRNDEVYAATGTRPRHPGRNYGFGTRAEKISAWQNEVAAAAARIPDQSVGERLNRSIEADALAIARQAEMRADRFAASRPTVGGFVAGFAGSMVGAMRDPLVFASLAFGGGVGGARTVAGRVLVTATREALINGATTALAQADVQAWRRAAGLSAGFDEALNNVAFAGLMGGVFGAAGQGITEGVTRIRGRGVETASRAIAADEAVPARTRAAVAGDAKAAAELLKPIRPTLPPAARGALDAAETIEHLDTLRPPAAAIEHHDRTVSAAHRAVEQATDPDFSFKGFEPDPAQVTRIADQMAPPVSSSQGSARPLSLTEFITARGGVLDDRGELAAIGASDLAKNRARGGGRGKGKVVDRRMPLDRMREAAEEAGYIGLPGETGTTRVADLLDAIDREKRGERIYAREDAGRAGEIEAREAERARVEDTIDSVARAAGPAVDDSVIRRAAELSLRDGLDPDDALERVLMRAELDVGSGSREQAERIFGAAIRTPDGKVHKGGTHAEILDKLGTSETDIGKLEDGFVTTDGRFVDRAEADRIANGAAVTTRSTAELLPGWSDEELDAIAGPRSEAPRADGIDDPGAADDDLALSATAEELGDGDDILPGLDGTTSMAAMLDDIARLAEEARVVKACRV